MGAVVGTSGEQRSTTCLSTKPSVSRRVDVCFRLDEIPTLSTLIFEDRRGDCSWTTVRAGHSDQPSILMKYKVWLGFAECQELERKKFRNPIWIVDRLCTQR